MLLHTLPLLRTTLAFVVVLGVLVFVHELGHYLVARWRGVHVDVFSIGFGRAITSWTDRVGTLWKVGWLPLGGYVKLHGQERPADVPDDVRARWMPGRTFHEKSVGSRALVVAAGPAANFLLAAVLFAGLFAIAGRPVTLPVVGQVLAGSGADQAGLQSGDRLLSIDGTPIKRFEDIQRIVTSHPDQRLSLLVERSGQQITLTATTQDRVVGGKRIGMLGISAGPTTFERLSPWRAITTGFAQTWQVTAETLDGAWQMISGRRGTEELGGPLRIAQLSGQVAQLGIASLISFIAVLSVNLGLINLFPIPILDGGHLLFYLVEAVLGRPLPQRAQEYGLRAGFAVLVGLFIFVTWNDLTHLGLFRWVAGLIG
jgi:regulator of sigma E protease